MLLVVPFLVSCLGQATQASYPDLKATVSAERVRYQARYQGADSSSRVLLRTAARSYLLEQVRTEFLPRWYGTPWDFNGITRTPREGRIACGYFMTTLLQDVGFDLPRYKWAQLAAEPVILKLAPDARRFRHTPVHEVERWVRSQGHGLYAAGLDRHVGFILYHADSVRFIHSNYYQPAVGVMPQALDAEGPFLHSSYRVIGQLFNDTMMHRWIEDLPLGP